MNITFLANQADISGGEVMLFAMAEAARTLGHQVEVITPAGGDVVDACTARGLTVRPVTASQTARTLLGLRREAALSDADLLWCNGLRPAFATTGLPRRVVHLHQEANGAQTWLAHVARLRAMVTVVPSRFLASQVRGARVLDNWVAEPCTADRLPILREEHRPVVGYLGRLSSDKGIPVLAEAVQNLHRSGIDVVTMVAGEPRFVRDRDAELVDAALADVPGLVRPGWVDRDAFFASVDLAVFPSVWGEAFGLVAAEAMAARVPLVVSDAGALPEVVGPHHPGIARRGDAGALARTIAAALSAPNASTSIDDAYSRWKTRYSPQAGLERMAALLEELSAGTVNA